MLVHFGWEDVRAEWSGSVVCIGVFDGVHIGHQALIGRALALAAPEEKPVIVVTFDRHPAAILNPARAPQRLASLGQNLDQLSRTGAAMTSVLKFDSELAQTSADDFLKIILEGRLKAEKLVIGEDFALGRNREGTAKWLGDRVPVEIVSPIELEGSRVSSSRIRQSLVEGQVELASRLLGRSFGLSGVVVSGQKLGRQLGWPTVNLARSCDQVVPLDGVYAGTCQTPLGEFAAAISVGMRPAVAGESRTIEAYLLDYPGDSLYGASIDLTFTHRLRGEENFDGLPALKEQIGRDVDQVRALAAGSWP